ncbi:tyrosine--tRNA ligase [Epidermidibacterium keratini]|uniref:Tyrosine--tRNA ligase n=1 Tax=Epidermidibacterium keratini TaxID=1891644 RepID=A0A7L4YIA0_9ACTN|nr:tyrosine--tRNA ligase [Epidermidibacterium keratini]QHB98947.1 tyrosine--tRNA ligase [Epidermidibacterium keratini]
MNPLLEDLAWRGLIADTTDIDALSAALDEGPITMYVGFDPTAPSLHHGNLVQLITARRFQDAGHRVLGLVGGSTGLIGDPGGRTAERQLNPKELVAEWVQRLQRQVAQVLDFGGDNPATLVNNLDWTAPLSAIDFLRDIGKHFRVGKMIAKDAVSARLNSEAGISYTEFSYQILQAMDYLELYRRYGCTLQTGGSDQWGNLTAGVDLIRRVEGVGVHALAINLVTKADGTKFGKTAGGAIWLDKQMFSPYAFHQYWLGADDRDIEPWMKVFSLRPRAEIEDLLAQGHEAPQRRIPQRALADELTTLVHGADELAAADLAGRALFGRGELGELDPAALSAALTEAGTADIARVDGQLPTIAEVLRDTGLAKGLGDARRAISEGGAYVNNERVSDPEARLSEQQLLGDGLVVVRRGKRNVRGVRVTA